MTDVIPANITGATWTSLYGNGAAGPTGSGNIGALVNLASGANITFTLTGTILSNASGNLTNTANVTPPAGITDPTPGNNTATDTDTPNPKADLQVTKTDGNLIVHRRHRHRVHDLRLERRAERRDERQRHRRGSGEHHGRDVDLPVRQRVGRAERQRQHHALVNLASGANITFTLTGTVLSARRAT